MSFSAGKTEDGADAEGLYPGKRTRTRREGPRRPSGTRVSAAGGGLVELTWALWQGSGAGRKLLGVTSRRSRRRRWLQSFRTDLPGSAVANAGSCGAFRTTQGQPGSRRTSTRGTVAAVVLWAEGPTNTSVGGHFYAWILLKKLESAGWKRPGGSFGLDVQPWLDDSRCPRSVSRS